MLHMEVLLQLLCLYILAVAAIPTTVFMVTGTQQQKSDSAGIEFAIRKVNWCSTIKTGTETASGATEGESSERFFLAAFWKYPCG